MSTSILLIPESSAGRFSPDAVALAVRSLWPDARENRLTGELFVIRFDVPERNLTLYVGRSCISITPGETWDDCAVVAHRILEAVGGSSRFHFMDSGNNHALLVDHHTPLSTLGTLPDAPPL
jgi:hypothetical protein